MNYGKEGVVVSGDKILAEFKAPFDFTEFNTKTKTFVKVTDEEKYKAICKKISPVYHVTKDSAPALIVHGDADDLVPIQQSKLIIAKYTEAGVPCELVTVKGGGHGFWLGIDKDINKMANWLDKYLLK